MKRHKHPKPLPGWNPPQDPVEVIESVSDDEKAGHPVPPPIELHPGGPPVEIVEGYPNLLPAPRRPLPFDRNVALGGLHAAFASLSDEELQVARMRMLGAVPRYFGGTRDASRAGREAVEAGATETR